MKLQLHDDEVSAVLSEFTEDYWPGLRLIEGVTEVRPSAPWKRGFRDGASARA